MTDKQQPEALRLADLMRAAVQIFPQRSEDEHGGYASEVDQIMDEAAAELLRLHAENEALAEAGRISALKEVENYRAYCAELEVLRAVYAAARLEIESLRAARPMGAQHGVGNSGFDHSTAADFLNGKNVSDEAVRKFVSASRWAHDDRSSLRAQLLSMRGDLASREAEIALLKKALMDAEQAPAQPDNSAVHLSHCNMGEHVGSCKYGDDDCPALRKAPAQAAPELTETAITAKNPAAPVSSFEDSRTQAVYEVLVNDNYPPAGSNEHWEGWKARLIVDALFPIEAPAAVAGPSDHELDSLIQKFFGWMHTIPEGTYRAFAREVLAQFGAAPTTQPAPQQEAQEPVAWLDPWTGSKVTTDYDAYGKHGIPLYTAPQPSPASQGDALDAARYRWLREQPFDTWKRIAWNTWNNDPVVWSDRDAAIDSARAAQEGK